jgi:hypothetical protein
VSGVTKKFNFKKADAPIARARPKVLICSVNTFKYSDTLIIDSAMF